MGKMTNSCIPFPIVEGMPEGNEKSFLTYSVCSNGIFVTKKVCGKGTVTMKVDGIKGLPEGNEEINVLSRKIPISYFWEIVKFFRQVKSTFKSKVEAYILLGYNFDEDKFILYVPKHSVGPAHVKYDIELFWKDNPGYYLMLDVHCHCDFGAFWSSTDNNDDNRDRYSMVIGYQDKVIPEFKLRFANGKTHVDIDFDSLFCDEREAVVFDAKKEIKKIDYKDSPLKMNGFIPPSAQRYDGGAFYYESLKTKMLENKEFTLQELFPGW